MEEESLVASRKRRSNAGSRLKQLLREEKAATGITGSEDDIDLLFAEDEEDGEFNEGDEVVRYNSDGDVVQGDDDEQEDEEEGEQDSAEEDVQEEEEDEEGNGRQESGDEDAAVAENSDDLFSDSEESSASEDSDEGEKELQKKERQKRKEKMKKARQIPKIKKPISSTPKVKRKYVAPQPETLLSETRRQSSRTTVVQSKLDLVEKLREEETRRASFKPVARVEYYEMTQEERLEEAKITQEYNTSTLNKYQEQEIEKKKKQRALQLSRRKKLNDIVSFTSCEKFVTVVEEHELEKFLLTRDKLKKKDRRGRKSDKQKREELEARMAEEKKRKRLEELEEFEEEKVVKQPKLEDDVDGTVNAKVEEIEMTDADVKTETIELSEINEVPHQDIGENDSVTKEGPSQNTEIEDTEKSVEPAQEKVEPIQEVSTEEKPAELTQEEPVEVKDELAQPTTEISPEQSKEEPAEPSPEELQDNIDSTEDHLKAEVEDKSETDVPHDTENKAHTEETVIKQENKLEVPEALTDSVEPSSQVKSVEFVDEISQPATLDTNDLPVPSSEETTIEPEIIYEGPLQKVSVNLISFENKLKVHEIKEFLFGADSLLGPSRRFKDLEPLIHIKKTENELQQFQSLDSKLQMPDYSILDKYFPNFGEFDRVKTEKIIPEATQDIKIQLTTAAPSGIYLPNGNKKVCLITGKPAMYFDPKTGMPYSSVESYKIIKSIQEGRFAWGDFRKGGAYFEDREESRHAKGVPEGFAG